MIQQTSVMQSPWILVESDNKAYARIKVMQELCNALERALPDALPG
jgi:polyphosphate kinase 2 (PPK2 family)